jgi:hypothetical protein
MALTKVTYDMIVPFEQSGAGAVPRDAESKLRDVVSLKDYGAVGDGVEDDTAAVQAAIDAAFAAGTKITVDGNDGTYLLSAPVVYPSGRLVTLCNAKFLADATFDTASYMLEVTSQDAGICNTDLVFDNLYFDAAHTGGCMVIDNYLRVVVNDCTFCHFSTDGLKLLKTLDSHECLVSKCFSFEYFYGEPGYLTPTPTSVGFNVASFDNSLTDVVCYYTGNGMVVDAQYNLVAQAHLGGSVNALHITPNAAFVSFSQTYIDSGRVLWEDPWNTEFVGCKFLHNTADTAFKFIVIKPLSAGRALQGAKVTNCSFHNINAATVTSVSVDTSAGSFDVSMISQCYIEGNSFVNSTPAFTKVRTSLFQTAATVWSFDLSTYFPFGNVQKAFCSYYAATTPTAVANITSISTNTVTVTASSAGNGTVYLEADINVGVS